VCPAPLTDWYEERTIERNPAARCSGATASIAVIVVQLGTATMRGEPSSASGFTSGIESGTAGSIRNADELSMHTVPPSAAPGMIARETEAPALTSATSTPRSRSSESSCTIQSSSRKRTDRPALRADESGISSSTGNDRSSRVRVISLPTAPVAPITATRMVVPG